MRRRRVCKWDIYFDDEFLGSLHCLFISEIREKSAQGRLAIRVGQPGVARRGAEWCGVARWRRRVQFLRETDTALLARLALVESRFAQCVATLRTVLHIAFTGCHTASFFFEGPGGGLEATWFP